MKLIKRIDKGAYNDKNAFITPQEHDDNIQKIEDGINANATAITTLENGEAGRVFDDRAAATTFYNAQSPAPEDGIIIYLIAEKEYHKWDSTEATHKTTFVRKLQEILEAFDPTDNINAPTHQAVITGVKENITDKIEIEAGVNLATKNNGYIPLDGGIGNPVSLTVVSSSIFRHNIIDAVEGDKFLVEALGGTVPRLWGFIDSSDNLLSVADAGLNTVGNAIEVTAPANTVKAVFNVNFGSASTSYVSKISLVEKNLQSNIDEEIDFIKGVIRVAPTYTQPTASITNVTQTVEKGTTLTDLDVDITFTQNDAGNANAYSLEKDDVEIETSQNNTITLTQIESTIVLKGIVSYDEGITRNDNLGEPYPTGKVLAGDVESSTRTITPRLRMWYGAMSSMPTNSTEVRAISSNVWDNNNSITLATGTTDTNFVVAVPSSKTTASTLSAQDTTNNISLTYEFEDTITVNLPYGTQEYRIYTLTVGNAYPTSANHIISL